MAYVNRTLMSPQMAPFTGSLGGGGGEPRTGLLAKLRAATRTEHDAIEASLGLLRASLTVQRYRKIVECSTATTRRSRPRSVTPGPRWRPTRAPRQRPHPAARPRSRGARQPRPRCAAAL